MKIFTCEHQLEAMMTCIYEAWSEALRIGHENVRLMLEPIYQFSLFDEYIHIDTNGEKAEKVIRTIQRKLGTTAYIWIYYAVISQEDTLDDIYRFLRIAFRQGSRVLQALTLPEVMRLQEIRRRVGNEVHYFREFARFNSIGNQVYVCHLEPKNDVIELVAEHFADRMPSEYFMIVDDKRRYAVIHDLNDAETVKNSNRINAADNVNMENGEKQLYIRELSEKEWELLKKTEEYPDEYRRLWKTFFDTIGIEQRRNPTCQRNLMPLWMRKHAVEFMDAEPHVQSDF